MVEMAVVGGDGAVVGGDGGWWWGMWIRLLVVVDKSPRIVDNLGITGEGGESG
jgi:hypothetical protein